MRWQVFLADGTRYALYGLDSCGALDPEQSVKLELFASDGLFLGGTSLYGQDERRRSADHEGWHRKQLARVGCHDEGYSISLLDYLIEARSGRVDPHLTPPPRPRGGRVEQIIEWPAEDDDSVGGSQIQDAPYRRIRRLPEERDDHDQTGR